MRFKYISSKEMKKIDETAIKDYYIKPEILMENAGRNIAEFISKLNPEPKRVIIFLGKGNNAGDGLVTARHLLIKGFKIKLVSCINKNEFRGLVKEQFKILNRTGINLEKINNIKIKKRDIIIDALLGYDIKGFPRGEIKEMINKINYLKNKNNFIKIISIDISSGMNSNESLNKQLRTKKPIVKADYILTLGFPKKSLKKCKNVYLLNIGIPWCVYNKLGIIRTRYKDYFAKKDIIKI